MKVYLKESNKEQIICHLDIRLISSINKKDTVNIKGKYYLVKAKVLYFQNSDSKGDNIDLDYVILFVEELK